MNDYTIRIYADNRLAYLHTPQYEKKSLENLRRHGYVAFLSLGITMDESLSSIHEMEREHKGLLRMGVKKAYKELKQYVNDFNKHIGKIYKTASEKTGEDLFDVQDEYDGAVNEMRRMLCNETSILRFTIDSQMMRKGYPTHKIISKLICVSYLALLTKKITEASPRAFTSGGKVISLDTYKDYAKRIIHLNNLLIEEINKASKCPEASINDIECVEVLNATESFTRRFFEAYKELR